MATYPERVHKNSFPSSTILWKRRIALVCLLGMIGGLLCSRAAASICMMLFGIVALWGISPKQWLRERWWLLGLGWIVLYALSYFWSDDKGGWNEHLQVKLPFLLLPLSFALLPRFTAKDLRIYTWALATIMLAGALFSISFLWRDAGDIIEGYKYAHVLRTPMYNDHIAFSTAVAASIAWIAYFLPSISQRAERMALAVLAMLLAIYLHVLAAKTGLIAFYIFVFGLIIFLARKNLRQAALLFVLAAGCFALAYIALPTFRERIGYSYVTWRSYRMGERHGMYSDAGRLISYNIAAHSITAHPLGGVGAGDVLHEMKDGYARRYPQVPEAQQLWPHNQWLTCAMAAGIPAALLFTIWLVAPLRRIRRNREGAFFLMTWAMLLVPLMVDPFLEVQFGVAVFLIFLLVAMRQCNNAAMR